MVLNLHGEVPSDDEKVRIVNRLPHISNANDLLDNLQNISVLNAEKHFLQHLRKLATDFPKLKIVLEHATTKEAVDCVGVLQ